MQRISILPAWLVSPLAELPYESALPHSQTVVALMLAGFTRYPALWQNYSSFSATVVSQGGS